MSIILVVIALFGVMVTVLAAGVAILKPVYRSDAIVVGVLGFSITAASLGFVLFVISQMN